MTEESLIEALADIEHARWAHWQRYLHSVGDRTADGSLIIPAKYISRWERQISASYEQLSDTEKESDRGQVRKIVPILRKFIAEATK